MVRNKYLNAECSVRTPFSNDAATAKVATAMTFCLGRLSTDCIAHMVNVFPVPPGASRKYARGRWE